MTSSSQACSAITGPITNTATYTYSDAEGFTPPKSCLAQTYNSQPLGSDTFFSWLDTSSTAGTNTTSTRWFHAFRGRDAACFPSHYPKACEWLGTIQQQQNYIFSPASCPGGYVDAATRTSEAMNAVTTGTCCPSGYSLSTPVVNIGDTFYGDPVTCTSVGTSIIVGESTTTFEPDVLTLYAPTVMVAWENSDIARWKTTLPSATSTGTEPSSDDSSASKSSLSTGAKAGIGAGCAVLALVALAGFLLFFRRRSQRKRRVGIETISITPKETPQFAPPLSVKEKGKKDKIATSTELGDDTALQEMTSDGRRIEADDKSARAELP